MLADATTPSRTLRRFGRASGVPWSVWSLIGCRLLDCPRLGERDLALAQDHVDAGDVLLHAADGRRVVEAAGHQLEAEVEELLLGLGEAVLELGVDHLAEL